MTLILMPENGSVRPYLTKTVEDVFPEQGLLVDDQTGLVAPDRTAGKFPHQLLVDLCDARTEVTIHPERRKPGPFPAGWGFYTCGRDSDQNWAIGVGYHHDPPELTELTAVDVWWDSSDNNGDSYEVTDARTGRAMMPQDALLFHALVHAHRLVTGRFLGSWGGCEDPAEEAPTIDVENIYRVNRPHHLGRLGSYATSWRIRSNGPIVTTGGCFVATAAFGSPLDPRVQELRRFREEILRPTRWGRLFFDRFYADYARISPQIVAAMADDERVRDLVRWAVVTPLVDWLALAQQFPDAPLDDVGEPWRSFLLRTRDDLQNWAADVKLPDDFTGLAPVDAAHELGIALRFALRTPHRRHAYLDASSSNPIVDLVVDVLLRALGLESSLCEAVSSAFGVSPGAPLGLKVGPSVPSVLTALGTVARMGLEVDLAVEVVPLSVSVTSDGMVIHGALRLRDAHPTLPRRAVLYVPPPTPGSTVRVLHAGESWSPGRGIASYRWRFGDGSAELVTAGTQARFVVAHRYQPGTYDAMVTIRDDQGWEASASVEVTPGVLQVDMLAPEADTSAGGWHLRVPRVEPFEATFRIQSDRDAPSDTELVLHTSAGILAHVAADQDGQATIWIDPADFDDHPGPRGPGNLVGARWMSLTARAPGHPDTERTIWMGGVELQIRDWQYCEELLGWIHWPEDVRRQAWQENVVLTPAVDHALTEFSETIDTLVRLCGAAERSSTALPASAVLNLPRQAPIEAIFQRLDRLADIARIQYEQTALLVARQYETVPAAIAAPPTEVVPGPEPR